MHLDAGSRRQGERELGRELLFFELDLCHASRVYMACGVLAFATLFLRRWGLLAVRYSFASAGL